jgi:hypothetical protein
MSATIEDLIISLEVEEEQAKRRGERSRAEIRSILEHGRAEGRANLTPQEDEDVQRAQKADVASKVDLKGIKQRLDVARRTKMAELEADEALVSRGPGGAVPLPDSGVRQRDGSRPAYDQVARIGSGGAHLQPGQHRQGWQVRQRRRPPVPLPRRRG